MAGWQLRLRLPLGGKIGAAPYLAHSARSVKEAARWVEYTNSAADTAFTLYAVSDHLRAPSVAEYDAVVAQACYFEDEISAYADLVAAEAGDAGVTRPLSLALDEWNIRHLEPGDWPAPEPGADGGIASRDLSADPVAGSRRRVNRWSPRTLADALFYAGVFHAMHRASGHAVPVQMANTVNLVNANGVLAVRPGGLVRSASFHVFDLYRRLTGPVSVEVDVAGTAPVVPVRHGVEREDDGTGRTSRRAVPIVDTIATTRGGRVQVVAINRHPSRPVPVRLRLAGGAAPRRARVHDLGGDPAAGRGVAELFAVNTISSPERVILRDRGERSLDDAGYELPPHSVTAFEFDR